MAKEWILNIATNRWHLNRKESVGPVSERSFFPKKKLTRVHRNNLKILGENSIL